MSTHYNNKSEPENYGENNKGKFPPIEIHIKRANLHGVDRAKSIVCAQIGPKDKYEKYVHYSHVEALISEAGRDAWLLAKMIDGQGFIVKDYACLQCVEREGLSRDAVIDHFQCAYHRAKSSRSPGEMREE